ncbi:MAG: hypothetical protein ACPLXC_00095 [Candidatus Pacearchaeota archaeon]
MESKQKLPKELKAELTELLGAMKRSLKAPAVYNSEPEEIFLKRIVELEKQGYSSELEEYKKKYEKLRYQKEQLEKIWLGEK